MKAKVTSFLRTYKLLPVCHYSSTVASKGTVVVVVEGTGGGGAGRGLDLQFLEKGSKVVPKLKFSRIFAPTLKNNEFDPLEFSVFLRPCAVKHCHGFHSCHSSILNKESI